MCKVAIEDIGGESCEPTGGMVARVYIAPVSDFQTISAIPAFDSESTDAQLATIATDHVFKSGKGFSVITAIEEAVGLKSDPIGEVGRSLFGNELAVEVAGSDAQHIGASRRSKNGRYIVLVEEVESGRIRQLGSRGLPARVKVSHVIESNVEGKNSATWTISDKSKCAAPIYAGAIVLLNPESE